MDVYNKNSGQILTWDLEIPLLPGKRLSINHINSFVNVVNSILKISLKNLDRKHLSCYILCKHDLNHASEKNWRSFCIIQTLY